MNRRLVSRRRFRGGFAGRDRIRAHQLEGCKGVIIHRRHNGTGSDGIRVGLDDRKVLGRDALVNSAEADAVFGNAQVVDAAGEVTIEAMMTRCGTSEKDEEKLLGMRLNVLIPFCMCYT